MARSHPLPDDDGQEPGESFLLLQRAQAGDREALDDLMAHYLPRLKRWASGRLPHGIRDLADTTDLVQDALIQTFKRIETVHAGRDGGLQAYLRQAVLNRIRDEFRRARRRPAPGELDSAQADPAPSPLETAIGRQAVQRYERALAELRPAEREVIVARIELGCTYDEVARVTGRPSGNAARMAVERAMARLIELMQRYAG
jgi:RNA polymerase sigma-70 factor, ECF subfamily